MAKFIDLDTGLPALLNKVKAWVNSKTEDFITAQDVASIVVGSADVVITETENHIKITFVTSSITVKVGNDEVSGISLHTDGTAHESEQLSISGNHLKANIGAALSGAGASDYELSTDGTTYDSTALIAVTNEAVSNASLYVRYKGAKTAGTVSDATMTLTAGSFSKTISLHYSYASGPYISVSPATLSFSAASGSTTDAKTLAVTGSQLTAGITATVSGTGFTVSASESGTYGSQTSLPSSGGTLYVKFSPTGSSASTGTLTLESTGATSKTVTLTGAVAGTLSISPASASIGIASGGSGTKRFTVQGANLTPASTATVEVSGTGMSADKQTLTVGQDGTINEVVTVTFSGSADSNGTLTVNHADVDNAATASIAGVITTPLPVDAEFQVGKLKYKVLSGQSTVSVAQISSSATTGDITIPSTVNDSGVTATLTDSSTQLGVGCTYTVTTIASSGFNGNKNITSLVLPNTITAMGTNGIRDLSNNGMTSFVIPNSVTSISANNLYGMKKLTSLTIGSGVTVLPDYFMGSCEAMRSITIPNNITEIKTYAFTKDKTTSFTDVDLGTGLTKIGASSSFRMTDNGVVTIRYTGGVISTVGAVFRNQSGGYPTTATLYVPSSLVDTYKAAPGFGVNNNGGWHMFDPNNIYAIQE